MQMHEVEKLKSTLTRMAAPSGWLYCFYGGRDGATFVPDEWADHVVAYRRAQSAKHKLPLPEYMRQPADDGFSLTDAGFIADIAVALEVDPEASFDVIYTKARDVMAALKQAEDVPEVDDGREL